MIELGLVGHPLSHSFSPSYFEEKFLELNLTNYNYKSYETIDLYQFIDEVRGNDNFLGFNVTIPYKESIVPLLDGISNDASFIGAVNTVKKIDGKLHGFNTDVYGFLESLKPLLKLHHRRALILGTGGAARAVRYGLKSLSIASLLVSRYKQRGEITYEQLNEDFLKNYSIIINTTPLGMSPNTDSYPTIPYQYIHANHLCYDLVYNPKKTMFLQKAARQGATIKNGLQMLHLQADRSWEIWKDETLR